jgi:hypothetical protein
LHSHTLGFPLCAAKKQRKRKKKIGGEEKKEKETAASGLVGKRTEANTTVSSLSGGVALRSQRRLGALRHIDAFQEPHIFERELNTPPSTSSRAHAIVDVASAGESRAQVPRRRRHPGASRSSGGR